jgi:hypothetical protein
VIAVEGVERLGEDALAIRLDDGQQRTAIDPLEQREEVERVRLLSQAALGASCLRLSDASAPCSVSAGLTFRAMPKCL